MFMSIFNLMGAQTDRFRYEVFQNLFLSPMNTVFLRDAVATVLTVYGIETTLTCKYAFTSDGLQQYLPFTVLKQTTIYTFTVYEFYGCNSTYRLRY